MTVNEVKRPSALLILRFGYNLSFRDNLIVASALAGGAAPLYSEDMQYGLIQQARNRVSISTLVEWLSVV